jgi:outer membrane receptor protein involved in Fe transport
MSFRLNELARLTMPALVAATSILVPTKILAEETNFQLEEITVTGSYIKRKSQSDQSTPLSSFDQSSLQDAGVKDLRDLIEIMPTNSGAQNNSDNLTQNFTAGTSNINLRGLGVSSTLVLLNGKRQVLSAVQTNDGSSFVDTASLVPTLAVERMEVLKDGASAIYGSDAVAGVANFITRDDLDGAELQWEYRKRTDNGSQDDLNIDGVVGGSFGESGHFLLAASYLDRSSLVAEEVDWLVPTDSLSGSGNPGTFVGDSIGKVADPNCEEHGGYLIGGSCRFDYGPQVTFVPDEQRIQGFARATWDWDETTEVWSEIGYARNKITREVSPSFPVLNAPTVSADHPENTFGEDVLFIGRPYGNGAPTELNHYDHNTFRFAFGASGEFTESLFWEASYVGAQNDVVINVRDVNVNNYQRAIDGLGGVNCKGDVPDAEGCLRFNPFSTSFTTAPNDPALKDYIIGEYLGDAESEMNVMEFIVSGNDLFSLPGGEAGFALGFQYREESLSYVYDTITQHDGWGFLIGNPNFSGERDVSAVFAEVMLPLTETIEVSAAVRYEDYGGVVGDTTDPKLSVLYRPTETLSFRGSISTSFRAPSVFQTQGIQTSFVNIRDRDANLVDGEVELKDDTTFSGNRTVGTDTLTPETSTALNIGLSWAPNDVWEVDLDYWSFTFEDVLTQTNAQAIVSNENYIRGGAPDANGVYNPNPDLNFRDPRVVRDSAGTVSIVNTAFVNANAIETSGIDLSVRGYYETDIGSFSPSFDSTYVLTYDLEDESGNKIDGAGSRNRTNFGNPSPELRANLGLGWAYDKHSANLFVRYVSSYDNDQYGQSIESSTTMDAQYSLDLGDWLKDDTESTLTLGVVNLTGENPPFVKTPANYDPRTGDPRGRRIYLKIGTKF